MKFEEMDKQDQMDWIARDILILSVAYYELNYNLVTDELYDKRLKFLCNFVEKYPTYAEASYYSSVLKDIDPSTGFDLVYKLTPEHREYLTKIASHCIHLHKMDNMKQKGR